MTMKESRPRNSRGGVHGLLATPLEMAMVDRWQKSDGPQVERDRPGRWDIADKIARGRQIADDELKRHAGHHNNLGDARRHAEWSRRMTTEIGPVFSAAAGLQHELQGLWEGQPLGEAAMDMRNNIEGIRAGLAGRAVDEERLVDQPGFRRAYGRPGHRSSR